MKERNSDCDEQLLEARAPAPAGTDVERDVTPEFGDKYIDKDVTPELVGERQMDHTLEADAAPIDSDDDVDGDVDMIKDG